MAPLLGGLAKDLQAVLVGGPIVALILLEVAGAQHIERQEDGSSEAGENQRPAQRGRRDAGDSSPRSGDGRLARPVHEGSDATPGADAEEHERWEVEDLNVGDPVGEHKGSLTGKGQ